VIAGKPDTGLGQDLADGLDRRPPRWAQTDPIDPARPRELAHHQLHRRGLQLSLFRPPSWTADA
jgi:hypothetical protein